MIFWMWYYVQLSRKYCESRFWTSVITHFNAIVQTFVTGSSEFGWENKISQMSFPSIAFVQIVVPQSSFFFNYVRLIAFVPHNCIVQALCCVQNPKIINPKKLQIWFLNMPQYFRYSYQIR
jgi:hypothetical protein